jgi:hypothetical protein
MLRDGHTCEREEGRYTTPYTWDETATPPTEKVEERDGDDAAQTVRQQTRVVAHVTQRSHGILEVFALFLIGTEQLRLCKGVCVKRHANTPQLNHTYEARNT